MSSSESPLEEWQQPYADAGHDLASVFNPLTTKCKRCGTPQIDLSEDLVYGPMRKCRATRPDGGDWLAKDIGRKCADDVSAAIHRNMHLMPDARGKFLVAVYAAVTGIAAATGAFAAASGGEQEPDERMIDELWKEFFRPLALGQLPKFVEDRTDAN